MLPTLIISYSQIDVNFSVILIKDGKSVVYLKMLGSLKLDNKFALSTIGFPFLSLKVSSCIMEFYCNCHVWLAH